MIKFFPSDFIAAASGTFAPLLPATSIQEGYSWVTIRIFFPELTEEVRQTLIKLVKEKVEKTRIALRNERDNTWADIQKKEKNKEISEDDKFRYKEEMQKIIDDENKNFEMMTEKKEREIKN